MKLFHLSDLHIGKMLNGYSLRESQKNAFLQILKYAEEEKPDAILICGDIYDKSVPAGEAYTLFDWFLTELSGRCPGTEILIIAGNHDSPERLAYGASFLAHHRIHIAALPPADRTEYLKQVTLTDEWGPVHFYLVPFIRPGHVRHLFDYGTLYYKRATRTGAWAAFVTGVTGTVLLQPRELPVYWGFPVTLCSTLVFVLVPVLESIWKKRAC